MSQVAVIQQGPVLTMSSREIADLTGKKHKNVLRDIREMLEALRKDGSDLSHVREDLDSRGYTENFHLDRDLTETLISGYSVPLRYRVIRRLHELESSQVPSIPTTLPEALRLAADQAEQNHALRLVISEQAPKVQALERLSGAAGTMCITDAAKHLKINPSRLFDWLQQNRWIYRRSGSARWIGYQPANPRRLGHAQGDGSRPGRPGRRACGEPGTHHCQGAVGAGAEDRGGQAVILGSVSRHEITNQENVSPEVRQ